MFYLLAIINSNYCRFNISQWAGNQRHHRVFHNCFLFRYCILFKLDTNGKLRTQLYDKRDGFNFSIVNFLYLCINISFSHAYGVYILQIIRYARVCSTYDQFFNARQSTDKQVDVTWVSTVSFTRSLNFSKFYGRYNDLVCQYNLSLGQILSSACMCFILIVKPFLIHWFWQRLIPFTWSWYRAHGGCDRSTGSVYS
jgi:hypothetical protein